jgi:hypothetical protein
MLVETNGNGTGMCARTNIKELLGARSSRAVEVAAIRLFINEPKLTVS